MTFKKVTITSLLTVILILILNDVIYYYSVRNSLNDSLARRMISLSEQIKLSVDHVEYAYSVTDELMAEKLRAASIAIQNSLPPDYKDVENEHLVRLRNELGISDIALFTPKGDDMVVVRSSDPKELNMGSKTWGDYFTAFNQLWNLEPVTVKSGLAMKNFWAGKLSGSASNPSSLKNKYGYYYDGTTNYIINPYIDSTYIQRVEANAGVDTIIQNTLSKNPELLEITGYNPRTFSYADDDPRLFTETDGKRNPRYSERKIVFGSYNYPDEDDIRHVEAAAASGTIVTDTGTINGHNVLKVFYPVTEDIVQFPYVISLTSSLDEVSGELNKQLLFFIAVIVLVTLVSIVGVYIIFRYMNQTKNEVAQAVQENYTNEMNNLVVAFRGQHHDFNNHLNTIKAFMDLDRYANAKQYLDELVGETKLLQDMIEVGHPAIASLLHAKVTQAISRKIRFTYDFESVGKLDLVGMKSVDIVKIIGNLVDNAFDEVSKLNADNRRVHVACYTDQGRIKFKVSNSLSRPLNNEELERMFDSGYSSKTTGEHKGLGLAIVKERVLTYRGNITVTIEEDQIIFHVDLPAAS
ncbi:sensor histidine kinase [Paenibacillus tarimensis]|nr:GHKL domain-containing protein [Paenibacillus tarimensis]